MPNDIEYRNAIVQDATKLSILLKQVYIQTYGAEGVSDEFANFITKQFAIDRLEKITRDSPGNIIVALYKNNLVGAAEIDYNKKCPIGDLKAPELSKLYILEWFCGKGIGNQLITAAENTVREKGFDQIWLWVLASNYRALKFYEKQDYEYIGNASFQMAVNTYDNKVLVKQLRGS